MAKSIAQVQQASMVVVSVCLGGTDTTGSRMHSKREHAAAPAVEDNDAESSVEARSASSGDARGRTYIVERTVEEGHGDDG